VIPEVTHTIAPKLFPDLKSAIANKEAFQQYLRVMLISKVTAEGLSHAEEGLKVTSILGIDF